MNSRREVTPTQLPHDDITTISEDVSDSNRVVASRSVVLEILRENERDGTRNNMSVSDGDPKERRSKRVWLPNSLGGGCIGRG